MMANNPRAAENLKPFTGGDDPRRGVKPKGTKHLSTWIQEMLNDESFELFLTDKREGFVKWEGAPVKAIVRTALIHAANGDKKWADWLANNGYGQKLVHSNDPENPLTDPASKSVVDEFIEKVKDDTANQAKSD